MYHKDLLRRFGGDIKAAEQYANSHGVSIDEMSRSCQEAANRARGKHVAFHKLGK